MAVQCSKALVSFQFMFNDVLWRTVILCQSSKGTSKHIDTTNTNLSLEPALFPTVHIFHLCLLAVFLFFFLFLSVCDWGTNELHPHQTSVLKSCTDHGHDWAAGHYRRWHHVTLFLPQSLNSTLLPKKIYSAGVEIYDNSWYQPNIYNELLYFSTSLTKL